MTPDDSHETREPPSGSSDPVVLAVEDEEDVAVTYRLWLRGDCEVRVASDGEEGLARLDHDVDVVLLDRMMPGLSGVEVLDEIRKRGYDCRVAMVTAVDPDFDIVEMGFDAYLRKPVDRRELRETVANLLERSTYPDLLQEFHALAEKRATLESRMSDRALARSEEYAALEDRIAEIERQIGEDGGPERQIGEDGGPERQTGEDSGPERQ